MKKKIFAALSAAMLAISALGAPAFAAETTYKKGDINMDGEITPADSTLLLQAYTDLVVGNECILNEEQKELGNITGGKFWYLDGTGYAPFTLKDCRIILCYATYRLTELPVPDDIVEFAQQ